MEVDNDDVFTVSDRGWAVVNFRQDVGGRFVVSLVEKIVSLLRTAQSGRRTCDDDADGRFFYLGAGSSVSDILHNIHDRTSNNSLKVDGRQRS